MRKYINKRKIIRSGKQAGIKSGKYLKPFFILLFSVAFVLIILPVSLHMLFSQSDSSDSESEKEKSLAIDKVKIPATIRVYCEDTKKTITVGFEDYVKGVVAGEMPADFHKEALKAQSVAARTYSLSRVLRAQEGSNPDAHPKAPLCNTIHCQVYRSESELRQLKGEEWMNNGWKNICAAVFETKGELMYYDGKLVAQALFHSSSGGKTENSEDVFTASVPYLVSVDSPYEEDATHKSEKCTISFSELQKKFAAAFPNTPIGSLTESNIKILNRSSGGSVEKIQIGSATFKGTDVRQVLGLYSANFTVALSGKKATFTTKGSGHGVGMSQYGAKGMAEEGYNYRDILKHYYRGIEIQ